MIERKHTKYYERKIQSNKVECSKSAGFYYKTHDFKVPLCMPEFSGREIIEHHFLVDNDKGELVIGYDRIIFRDLMVQLGLTAGLKCQVFQRDGATVPME